MRLILIPIVVVLSLLALAALPTGYAQPTQGTTAQYLPLVFKGGPSPTPIPSETATLAPTTTPSATTTSPPTTTASPTSTTIPAILRIKNGDFEQGQTGWEFLDGAFAVNSTSLARSGTWSALLGGSTAADETLRQIVVVPPDRPYLSFWYTATSDETLCFYDRIFVWVNTQPGTGRGAIVDSIYDFCSGKTHAAYQQKIIDLRAYSGQTIQFDIDMATDSGFASFATIDDASFVATP